MLIIGITGTLGAGKGTIVDYLVQEKGFVHFSVRGFITEEINRQGLPVNRDADPMLRYDRIVMRNSETDRISFSTFIANEEREMQSTDPNKQNIGKCIEQADQIFYNNSTVSDLYKRLEAELVQLGI